MANEINEAVAGLGRMLEAVEGLRIYDRPPEMLNELPCAVIHFVGRDFDETLGGSTFVGMLRLTIFAATGEAAEAWTHLYEYLGATGPRSIERAVDADNTWVGSVDVGRCRRVENVGVRQLPGAQGEPPTPVLAADIILSFIKSVS